MASGRSAYMPDIEDEGRVVPLLVSGDKITARYDNGKADTIRVDFSRTQTHPNFPPLASYKELKARAVKQWKDARATLSRPAFPLKDGSTSTRRPTAATATLPKSVQDVRTTLDYRIHEDGTFSGKNLPPLPHGQAYKLAYVDIPVLPEGWKPPQLHVASQPLSLAFNRTKVNEIGSYMRSSKISLPSRGPLPISKKPQKKSCQFANQYMELDATVKTQSERLRIGESKRTRSTIPSSDTTSNSRKRKRGGALLSVTYEPLIIRIPRSKIDMARAASRRNSDDSDTYCESDVDEPRVCWSIVYMYPLTERYHTMYDRTVDAMEQLPTQFCHHTTFDVSANSVHPTSVSQVTPVSPSNAILRPDLTDAEITELAILAALTAMDQSMSTPPFLSPSLTAPYSIPISDLSRHVPSIEAKTDVMGELISARPTIAV